MHINTSDQKPLENLSIINTMMSSTTFSDISIRNHHNYGFSTIICIHSTRKSPAIGGCRFKNYDNFSGALLDSMKLSYAMSLKASMHDLPCGGAKSVIYIHNKDVDRKWALQKYSEHLNSYNGRYLTSVDIGSNENDINFLHQNSRYVLGYNKNEFNISNKPSVHTANGVFCAIKAAVKYRFGGVNISKISFAIEGVGNVGEELCKILTSLGAQVYASDINSSKLEKVVNKYNVIAREADDISKQKVDVYIPCAVGATVNYEFASQTYCKIICGAANNQLLDNKIASILHDKGILYIPDYLANGGGLIYVAAKECDFTASDITQKIDLIYDKTLNILDKSKVSDTTPLSICNKYAVENI